MLVRYYHRLSRDEETCRDVMPSWRVQIRAKTQSETRLLSKIVLEDGHCDERSMLIGGQVHSRCELVARNGGSVRSRGGMGATSTYPTGHQGCCEMVCYADAFQCLSQLKPGPALTTRLKSISWTDSLRQAPLNPAEGLCGERHVVGTRHRQVASSRPDLGESTHTAGRRSRLDY